MSAIRLVTVSGPRGAGKETVLNALCAEFKLHRIVPHTTRVPRESEQDGREYHFVSNKVFDDLIAADRFVWYGQIGPTQRSGTVIDEFTKAQTGCVVDVKPEGARVMRQCVRALHGDALLLCIMASQAERRQRVWARQPGISEAEVERLTREDPVSQNVDDYHDFDHVIWNTGDDPAPACNLAVKLISKFILVAA